MPDPALLSGMKYPISGMPDTKEKYHVKFFKICFKYHCISQNQIMRPPGHIQSDKVYFNGRKKLKYDFLRSFFVRLKSAISFFWLYRKVKKGKLYGKTKNQNPVWRNGSMDGGYGRGISELLPSMVAAEKAGAEEPGSDGGMGI